MNYTHKKSGKIYSKIGEIQVELPDESWVPAIAYKDPETGKQYARSPARFESQFTEVLPPPPVYSVPLIFFREGDVEGVSYKPECHSDYHVVEYRDRLERYVLGFKPTCNSFCFISGTFGEIKQAILAWRLEDKTPIFDYPNFHDTSGARHWRSWFERLDQALAFALYEDDRYLTDMWGRLYPLSEGEDPTPIMTPTTFPWSKT